MLQNLYPHIASFHGLFRWIVLVLAVSAIYVAFSGWRGRRPASPNLFRLGLIFVLAMDLELISGHLALNNVRRYSSTLDANLHRILRAYG